MLVKLEKLTFYPFKINNLLFYYAQTDSITIRGIATPELAQALLEHLEARESFEVKVQQREDESYKLVELLQPAKIKNFVPYDSKIIPTSKLPEDFIPKQMSIYKTKVNLGACIKSRDGRIFFGYPNRLWIMWVLTKLRKEESIQLQTSGNRFSMGTECVTSDEFREREASTYLDNKKRFFFADDSFDEVFKRSASPLNVHS